MKMNKVSKNTMRMSVLSVLCVFFAYPSGAANSDVEIHIQPKQVDQSGTQTPSSGTVFRSKELWTYEVTIENKTFKELSDLELKYVIFSKQEKLGAKEAAKARRQNGSISL